MARLGRADQRDGDRCRRTPAGLSVARTSPRTSNAHGGEHNREKGRWAPLKARKARRGGPHGRGRDIVEFCRNSDSSNEMTVVCGPPSSSACCPSGARSASLSASPGRRAPARPSSTCGRVHTLPYAVACTPWRPPSPPRPSQRTHSLSMQGAQPHAAKPLCFLASLGVSHRYGPCLASSAES